VEPNDLGDVVFVEVTPDSVADLFMEFRDPIRLGED
jgi:hypothetical protein